MLREPRGTVEVECELPRHHGVDCPMSPEATLQLAELLPGIHVLLDDPTEDAMDDPVPRAPLGRVRGVEPREGYVTAVLAIFMESTFAPELIHAVEEGKAGFGLWARVTVDEEEHVIKTIYPTSVRLIAADDARLVVGPFDDEPDD